MFFHKRTIDDRGTVLLMALMIMSSVVVSSMGVGALIVRSMQQARAIDASMVAYYAAETGVEEALYEARRLDVLPEDVTVPEELPNGSEWTRQVTDREPVAFVGNLAQDATAEVALYDPEASTSAQGIASVTVSWTDDCGGCSVLQTTLVGWASGGPVLWDPNASVRLFTWNVGGATVTISDPTRLHRLRLNAASAAMSNIQVRAFDENGLPVDLPGRVRVDAIGRFEGTSQRLTATLPSGVPLSGIFDYVVFSECSLLKNGMTEVCL